ncbi:hypothetical protein T439DRAFT_376230 [Meredithblackwellia eburnea MCA 4105]
MAAAHLSHCGFFCSLLFEGKPVLLTNISVNARLATAHVHDPVIRGNRNYDLHWVDKRLGTGATRATLKVGTRGGVRTTSQHCQTDKSGRGAFSITFGPEAGIMELVLEEAPRQSSPQSAASRSGGEMIELVVFRLELSRFPATSIDPNLTVSPQMRLSSHTWQGASPVALQEIIVHLEQQVSSLVRTLDGSDANARYFEDAVAKMYQRLDPSQLVDYLGQRLSHEIATSRQEASEQCLLDEQSQYESEIADVLALLEDSS